MLRAHNPNLHVSPFQVLSCVDYGDVYIVPGYIERSYEAMGATLKPLISAGVVPLLLGGDHSCTLGHLRSLIGHTPVAVIDFDAHTDAWDSFFGEKYNHGTWVRRALEEGLIDAAHSIEVGLRGPVHGPDDWTCLKTELGLDYLTTEEVLAIGPTAVADHIRQRLAGRPAFLTFDIDVVDPAYAPGTGTPEAGGLSGHDALSIVRSLTGIRFVGFDIMEVIPGYDPGGITATLAANLGYEMLSLVAVERSGTSPTIGATGYGIPVPYEAPGGRVFPALIHGWQAAAFSQVHLLRIGRVSGWKLGSRSYGQEGLTAQRWAALARTVDELGLHSLWRSDHFVSDMGPPDPPCLETWTSLTALAFLTNRIQFGTLVSPMTFRHPALLARMATAVHNFSAGLVDPRGRRRMERGGAQDIWHPLPPDQ